MYIYLKSLNPGDFKIVTFWSLSHDVPTEHAQKWL